MSFRSRHLNATSPLLAHRGGVKPQWYANTIMDVCFKPWEVSCKTGFSIGQMLCKDVRGLRNWVKAKPVIARTRFEQGHFAVCVSNGLPHLGLSISPNLWLRGHRSLAHLLGDPCPPISSPSCATLLIRDSRCEKLFQNSRPFLTLRHSLSLSPNFTLNTIWECKLSREIVGIDKVVQQFKYSLRLLCTLKQCQTEEYFPNQLKT